MKKLSFLFFLCISFFLFAGNIVTIYADKYDWSEPSYNFQSIKNVLIYDMDLSPAHQDSPVIMKVLQQDYQTSNKKPPYKILSPEEAQEKINALHGPGMTPPPESTEQELESFFTENAPYVMDCYIESTLLKYEHGGYTIPAHTEWQSQTELETHYDKDGQPHTDYYTTTVPVDVPDEYVSNVTVRIRFQVYDAKTGEEIFSREEERTSLSELRDVYRRICASFFSDFKKKIKK